MPMFMSRYTSAFAVKRLRRKAKIKLQTSATPVSYTHLGKLHGYNTDYAGFAYLAGAHGVDFAGKTVLILGTGGTHSTVTAVCRDGGAKEILTASRTGKSDALDVYKRQGQEKTNFAPSLL